MFAKIKMIITGDTGFFGNDELLTGSYNESSFSSSSLSLLFEPQNII